MIIITVVRNFDMYNRLVRGNPFNQGADFVCFDNNMENQGLPQRYNSFLESYDYNHENWFVFCHEDWEIQEEWQPKIDDLDPKNIYAPIGCVYDRKLCGEAVRGEIKNSEKSGDRQCKLGVKIQAPAEIGTPDCQCLIVHSSLVEKYRLRFDEHLTFDLYAEDFCIWAREKYNISAYVLQLACQHYSYGSVLPRFYEQLNYLKQKYKNARHVYMPIAGREQLLGTGINAVYIKIMRFIRRYIFKVKQTNKGFLLVKFFKIPVYRRKIR